MCTAAFTEELVKPGWQFPHSSVEGCGTAGGIPWQLLHVAEVNVAVTVTGAVTFVRVQVAVVEAHPVHAKSCAPGPGVAVKVMLPPGVTRPLQSVGQLSASTTAPPRGAEIVPEPCTPAVIATSAAPNVADTVRSEVIATEQVVAVLP